MKLTVEKILSQIKTEILMFEIEKRIFFTLYQACAKLTFENVKLIFTNIHNFIIQVKTYESFVK